MFLFLQGDTIASVDSYGVVKLWDVRTVAPMKTVDLGPHPANRLAFDPTGQVLAVGSNDGTVKMYTVANGEVSVGFDLKMRYQVQYVFSVFLHHYLVSGPSLSAENLILSLVSL